MDAIQTRSRTHVLVAGAWLGGWAWDDVADRLRSRGHEVHAPTLPGAAEREPEATPSLDVTTHVDDLVGYLEARDLRDVVLVGHSYAGAVVTAAAARAPDRIARLVYVDAEVPRSDEPLLAGEPEVEEAMRGAAEQLDGWRVPLLPDEWLTSPQMYGAGDLTTGQLATFRERATGFPLACVTSPLPEGSVAGAAGIPRTYVRCVLAGPDPWWSDPDAREAEASYVELRAGHWPMWSQPEGLARILLSPVRTRRSDVDMDEAAWEADERTQLEAVLET